MATPRGPSTVPQVPCSSDLSPTNRERLPLIRRTEKGIDPPDAPTRALPQSLGASRALLGASPSLHPHRRAGHRGFASASRPPRSTATPKHRVGRNASARYQCKRRAFVPEYIERDKHARSIYSATTIRYQVRWMLVYKWRGFPCQVAMVIVGRGCIIVMDAYSYFVCVRVRAESIMCACA